MPLYDDTTTPLLERTIGKVEGAERAVVKSPKEDAAPRPLALTAREERVRRMLMRELEKFNKAYFFSGAGSYAERKNVVNRINPAYLEKEIQKMRKSLRTLEKLRLPVILLGIVLAAVIVIQSVRTGDFMSTAPFWSFPFIGLNVFLQAKATRRKLFIYEALYALSDAEETDVVLSQAIEEADRLIADIVERELEAEQRFGKRLTH